MNVVSGRDLATADDASIGDGPLAQNTEPDTPAMNDQAAASSWVIEATSANFQREVIERSSEVPVVIDFWAQWCGPCRMLGPLLERLAGDYGGQFVLAKINTEREPDLASEFGVRSIPAVFAVRDGRAVDGFVGVQSEAAIRAWLDRLMPTPAERIVAEARRLEASDPRAAEAKYNEALSLDPDLVPAQIGLARVALEDGRLEDAQARIVDMERQRVPRARGRAAQGRDHPPAPGAGGRRQRRGGPRRAGRAPRRSRAQVPARRGPGRRRPVRRRPGDLPRAGRTPPQDRRRARPPDHGRDLPAPAARFRARHRISATALDGADGLSLVCDSVRSADSLVSLSVLRLPFRNLQSAPRHSRSATRRRPRPASPSSSLKPNGRCRVSSSRNSRRTTLPRIPVVSGLSPSIVLTYAWKVGRSWRSRSRDEKAGSDADGIARGASTRFFFFSNEGREPPHIHVKAGGDEAKFWLDPDGSRVQLRVQWPRIERDHGPRSSEHLDELLEAWHEHLG